MLARKTLLIFATGIFVAGGPCGAFANDWSDYIWNGGLARDGGPAGLKITTEAAKDLGVNLGHVGNIGYPLAALNLVAGTVSRMERFHIGGLQAFGEQLAISGPAFGFGIVAAGVAATACAASLVCGVAVVAGGAAVSFAMSKSTETLLNMADDVEQRERQRQRDQLQAQKSTQEWQEQRKAQLAQKKQNTAVQANNSTPPNAALPSKPNGTTAPASQVQPPTISTSPSAPSPSSATSTPAHANLPTDQFLRAVMNDPKRPLEDRQWAARALRDTPTFREITAIGLGGTQALSSPNSTRLGTQSTYPNVPSSADAFLRAVMNDPKRPLEDRQWAARALRDTPTFREITAIGLGKNPGNAGQSGAVPRVPAPAPYVYSRPAQVAGSARNAPNPSSARPLTTPVYAASRTSYAGFPVRAPGGISLSRAAAMRMALDIDLEGASFSDGQIVFAGRSSNRQTIDAGLFLTALRAACEQGDPYFSLDADDGKAWIEDGNRAAQELWDRISNGLSSRRSGPAIQAFSARRDYPQLWSTISQKYPNLKTRLVFHPEWLRQTRFGEILYVADVLLKELAGGVPALPASRGLRAGAIERYVSADERRLLRTLQNQSFDSRSVRLWFDFLPQTEDGSRGTSTISSRQGRLAADGNILDLSAVHPKMFVRIHDLATHQDLPGHDPDLDALSEDINVRTEVYANAYNELRALTDVFRAYVAAIKIVQQERRICDSVTLAALPLLPSEKASSVMPEYHPSELFLTVAMRPGNQYSLVQVSSTNGGVSVRGKAFVRQELAAGMQTPVIRDMKQELTGGARGPTWKGSSGRQFIALTVDAFDPTGIDLAVPTKSATIEEVSLVSDYGPPINRRVAETALPYALISRDAYREEWTHIDGDTRRISDWKIVFANAGYSEGQIKLIEATGFFAAIYASERTKAVTIAYRGVSLSNDLGIGVLARLGNLDIQYKAAADLAWTIKLGLPANSITLTGHDLGGELAVFAGEQSGIPQVVTFNATAPLFTKSLNPAWINVGWVERRP